MLGSIMAFQARVRERVLLLYEDIISGKILLTRKVARVLFMTLEHEAFHAEVCPTSSASFNLIITFVAQTLLYMLLQRAGTGTIPPSGFIRPNWDVLVKSWDAAPEPESPTVQLGPTAVTLGHDDDEADDHLLYTPDHAFGWDNEHPQRQVNVGKFRIDWRPVTNGEFYLFVLAEGKGLVQRPESWVEVGGDLQVC